MLSHAALGRCRLLSPLSSAPLVRNQPEIERKTCTMALKTSPSGMIYGDTFWLDSFALRQFDDPSSASRIVYDKAEFLQKIHDEFEKSGKQLADGYAPFCKHVFVENFCGVQSNALAITPGNKHLLRSGYTRRRPEELPVLTRWFPAEDVEIPTAKFLDVILYSREQLVKEYADLPTGDKKCTAEDLPPVPWGIISVKGQDVNHETPMQPITIMRNSLGREEGGSGVPINRKAYEESVAFWDAHASIIAGTKTSGE